MGDENQYENLSSADIFTKARGVLDEMQALDKKGNALLLAYDSEKETFQMVALNADAEEIKALILSCMAAMVKAVQDVAPDRTLN